MGYRGGISASTIGVKQQHGELSLVIILFPRGQPRGWSAKSQLNHRRKRSTEQTSGEAREERHFYPSLPGPLTPLA